MTMPEADAQLPLKKRARRRLVGAIALAVLAAVVLPMIMDQSPQRPVSDVEIRIPGQDQVPPFNPKALAEKTSETPAAKAPVMAEKAAEPEAKKPPAPVAVEPAKTPVAREEPKAADKAADKSSDKAAAKPAPPAAKEAKASAEEEANRAAAILSGKPASTSAKPAATVEHVILIGAFANPANVKQLQSKLGELNIKVYTEVLESPQGNKTRVRAGPFPTRESAEKALEKMKRIGVNGVIATR